MNLITLVIIEVMKDIYSDCLFLQSILVDRQTDVIHRFRPVTCRT